jgi:hypothetical protein
MGRPRKAKTLATELSAPLPSGELVPVSPAENKVWVQRLQGAIRASQLGSRNPLWNDQEELHLMQSASYTGRVTDEALARQYRALGFDNGQLPNGNISINDRFSKRHTVADMNIPRNPEAVIVLSMRYALENPFVAKAVRVKTDFICDDFEHKTHNAAAKNFYDMATRRLFIKTQLRQIVWSLVSIGICAVYWGGEKGGPLDFMQVLPPTACRFQKVLGKTKLYIKITAPMIAAVRDSIAGTWTRPENKAQYESMPDYWIAQIKAQMDKGSALGSIELADGSYTVIENNYASFNRNSEVLDGVPLQGAFDALQRYRLMAAGDFAVAWNVKNMLTLISEGDPSDPNYTPQDDLRLQKLQAQFAHPDYALTIVCDPTTQVRYVVPPLEVFDPKKYQQVEKEIKEVLNLPSFMWSNDGSSTFGAAVAEVELLRTEVKAIRMLLEEQLFYPLYTRLRAGVSRPGFSAADIPMPSFNQNSLHDAIQWLANAADLYSRGAISLQSLMDINGLDFDYEMKQKQIEHEKYGNTSDGSPGEPMNNSPARPLFEPSQGNLSPNRDKGGNEGDGSGNPTDGNSTPRNKRAGEK